MIVITNSSNAVQKGRKVLLWNQVKSRMEACDSELVLEEESYTLLMQTFHYSPLTYSR